MTGVGRRSSRISRKQGATSSSGLFFHSVYSLSSVHLARRLVTRFVVLFRASSLFSPPGTPCGVSLPGLFCFSVQKLWRERPILRGGSEQHASKRFLTVRSTSVAPSEEGNTQRKTFMPCTTSLFPAENRAPTFKPSRRLLQGVIFCEGKVVAD